MTLKTRNNKIYMVKGWESQPFSRLFGHFLFEGSQDHLQGLMTYISFDVPLNKGKEYSYIA